MIPNESRQITSPTLFYHSMTIALFVINQVIRLNTNANWRIIHLIHRREIKKKCTALINNAILRAWRFPFEKLSSGADMVGERGESGRRICTFARHIKCTFRDAIHPSSVSLYTSFFVTNPVLKHQWSFKWQRVHSSLLHLCFIAALFEISNPSDSCCWCKHCFWIRLFQLYSQWVLVLLPQSFLFSPLCCLLFVYVYEWGNFWKVITINNGAFPVIYQNIPGSFHHYACICRFGWAKQCPNCCCLRNMLLEFNPPYTCTFSSSISMQRTTLKCVKFPLEYSSNKSH